MINVDCSDIFCTLCTSQGMSTVPGTCSGRRTFKWQLYHPLKVSVFGQRLCSFTGELSTSEYRGMTGPAASEGMVREHQQRRQNHLEPAPFQEGLCGTPASTGGEEMRGDHAEQVLSILFEESQWVWKGCLGLGIFTRWCWEECWPWEVLFLLCELTDPFSFLRVCLCPGHVLQLPEFPLLLPGLSGCCFCALH